ncbi:MAG: lysophospholipid acyltransferase family protein [Dehalococcoidia bacterium]
MRPYYWFMRFLSQGALALFFHGRVFDRHNVPGSGGVMLACNHQSFFDPLAATCALGREGNYMARASLFGNPLFKRLISSVNAFPVKRGAADVGAIKEILRRLKAGKVVLVFVEGTRTIDGSIGKINPNAMTIAKRAGAAIVPTVIDGAFEAWPRTKLLPRPGHIHVTYAEPIIPQEVHDHPADRLAQTVAERLNVVMEASRPRRRRAAALSWLERGV